MDKVKVLLICNLLLVAIIFFVDLNTPLGIAGGVPYILCILCTLFMSDIYASIKFAVLTTLLTIIAALPLESYATDLYVAAMNRAYAILAIWGAAFIIYQKKKADLIVEESNKSSKKILQTVPGALLVVNPMGKIVFSNKFAQTLLAYEEEDMIGLSTDNLMDKALIEKHDDYIRCEPGRGAAEGE